MTLDTSVESAFDYLDDFRKLSAHMERPTGMMMGSKMRIETDWQGGRAVGSKVSMRGTIMGMVLTLEEVVTVRRPPVLKAWETINANLLVIGQYRLGFELRPDSGRTKAQFFIDYALPDTAPARWIGMLFGKSYARWCVARMAEDAVKAFP